MNTPDVDFDTIVIGSGAGGLTAALALARAGQRILVLEQHEVPGGWCHSFVMEGHRFSPGVHYIGGLQEGGPLRRIYEGLGIGGDLIFLELNPGGLDHVRAGPDRFDVPGRLGPYRERLAERFPRESRGIGRYFDLMERLDEERLRLERMDHWSRWLLAPFTIPRLLRDGFRPLARVLERELGDPFLRTIVAMAGCGDCGLPPSRLPAGLHAAVTMHYAQGGYYPRGGAYTIPRAFCRGLRRAGGEVRLRSRVSSIRTEDSPGGPRAVGVRLESGEELCAGRVLSNVDPGVTFEVLMDAGILPGTWRSRLRRTRYSTSSMSLFLAVDLDLEAMGFDSGNYWCLRSPDLENLFRFDPVGAPERSEVPGVFLTVTTLKDRSKRIRHHTVEVFALVPHDPFVGWSRTATGERPPEYEALKQSLAGRMLDVVETVIPGIRPAIRFLSIGSPLTNAHYVPATNGCIYGTEKTWNQLGPFSFPWRTPIRDLYVCGASVGGHGVMGATQSGLQAAAIILGCPAADLLRKPGPALRILPAENPESWPPGLRPRSPGTPAPAEESGLPIA